MLSWLFAVQGKTDVSRSQRTFVAEDPTVWVLETYPWSQPVPSPLMRLKSESDDSNDHGSCSQSVSNGSLSAATSSNTEDQLVRANIKKFVFHLFDLNIIAEQNCSRNAIRCRDVNNTCENCCQYQ